MESKAIDPVDFRAAQHKHWDSAAVGWKQWSEFNDSADGHISKRLVELAGVQSGSRVLDVAAGYGEPALTAARKAGPEGRVVATDISAEMLAFGRERAAAAGLGNVEFIESDASSLDFPQASFDAAVSRWGIIFEPDAEAAARRIRGFLEPGTRIAISSWGEPDQVPFLSIPMRTTMELRSAGCSKEVGSRRSRWSRTRSPSSSTPRSASPPTSGRSPPRLGR
jgi:ubiquinone/menaquinone biosynthesis C-methylase UbiE